MGQFAQQRMNVFLGILALGNIANDVHQPLRLAVRRARCDLAAAG